ncbi:hypothetical protein MIDIC_290007 [Alphaproteobacteria bacterium]
MAGSCIDYNHSTKLGEFGVIDIDLSGICYSAITIDNLSPNVSGITLHLRDDVELRGSTVEVTGSTLEFIAIEAAKSLKLDKVEFSKINQVKVKSEYLDISGISSITPIVLSLEATTAVIKGDLKVKTLNFAITDVVDLSRIKHLTTTSLSGTAGELIAGGTWEITESLLLIGNKFQNLGQIKVQDKAHIEFAAIENGGDLLAGYNEIVSSQALINKKLIGGDRVKIDGQLLRNSGEINSNDGTDIKLGQDYSGSGKFDTAGAFKLLALNIWLDGGINAKLIEIVAANDLNIRSKLIGYTSIDLSSGSLLAIDGSVQSQEFVNFNCNTLALTGLIAVKDGLVKGRANVIKVTSSGSIIAKELIDLELCENGGAEQSENKGRIEAQEDRFYIHGNCGFVNDGMIIGAKDSKLEVIKFYNKGFMVASQSDVANSLMIQIDEAVADSEVKIDGKISFGKVTIQSSKIFLEKTGEILATGEDVILSGLNSVINLFGRIQAETAVSIDGASVHMYDGSSVLGKNGQVKIIHLASGGTGHIEGKEVILDLLKSLSMPGSMQEAYMLTHNIVSSAKIEMNVDKRLEIGSSISSQSAVDIRSSSAIVVTKGIQLSGTQINLKAPLITLEQDLVATGPVNIEAEVFTNLASFTCTELIKISVTGGFINHKTVSSTGGAIEVSAGSDIFHKQYSSIITGKGLGITLASAGRIVFEGQNKLQGGVIVMLAAALECPGEIQVLCENIKIDIRNNCRLDDIKLKADQSINLKCGTLSRIIGQIDGKVVEIDVANGETYYYVTILAPRGKIALKGNNIFICKALKTAKLEVNAAQFSSSHYISVTNQAIFTISETLTFEPHSYTAVGALLVNKDRQPADRFECRGCTFKITGGSGLSEITANYFVVGPESYSIRSKKQCKEYSFGYDEGCRRNVLFGVTTHWFGDYRYYTASVCEDYEDHVSCGQGHYSVAGDLSLKISGLVLKDSYLSISGTLYMQGTPSLGLYAVETVKILSAVPITRYRSRCEGSSFEWDAVREHGWERIAKDFGWYAWYQCSNNEMRRICSSNGEQGRAVLYAGSIIADDCIRSALFGYTSGSATAVADSSLSLPNALDIVKNQVAFGNTDVIRHVDSLIRPHFEQTDLTFKIEATYPNGKVVTFIIDKQAFSGLDFVNAFINKYDFLPGSIWRYSGPLNRLALPSASGGGYEMHNFIAPKDDVPLDAPIDVRNFLAALGFQFDGVLETYHAAYVQEKLEEAALKFGWVPQLSGYDMIRLFEQLADNAIIEYGRLKSLRPGVSLAVSQVDALERPIVWPVWQPLCLGEFHCLSYEVFLNEAALGDFVVGAVLVSKTDINLHIGSMKLEDGGHIVSRGNVELKVDQRIHIQPQASIISGMGTRIEAPTIIHEGVLAVKNGKLSLKADHDIINIGTIYVENGDVFLDAGHDIVEVAVKNRHYCLSCTRGSIVVVNGNLGYQAGNDLVILGAIKKEVAGQATMEAQGDIVIGAMFDTTVTHSLGHTGGWETSVIQGKIEAHTPQIQADQLVMKSNGWLKAFGAQIFGASGIAIDGNKGVTLESVTEYFTNVATQTKSRVFSDTTVTQEVLIHKTAYAILNPGKGGVTIRSGGECKLEGVKGINNPDIDCREGVTLKEHEIREYRRVQISQSGLLPPSVAIIDLFGSEDPGEYFMGNTRLLGTIKQITEMRGPGDLAGMMSFAMEIPSFKADYNMLTKRFASNPNDPTNVAKAGAIATALLAQYASVTFSFGTRTTTHTSEETYGEATEIGGNVKIRTGGKLYFQGVEASGVRDAYVEAKSAKFEGSKQTMKTTTHTESSSFDVTLNPVSGSVGVGFGESEMTQNRDEIRRGNTPFGGKDAKIHMIINEKLEIEGLQIHGKEVDVSAGETAIRDVLDEVRSEMMADGWGFGITATWNTAAELKRAAVDGEKDVGAITGGKFGVMPYGSFTHTEQVEASGLVKFISGITGESIKITTGKLLYHVGQITGSKELILKAEQIVIADNVREYSINDDFSIGFTGSCSLDGKHFNPRISYRDNDVSFVLSPDVFGGFREITEFAKDFVHKIRDDGKTTTPPSEKNAKPTLEKLVEIEQAIDNAGGAAAAPGNEARKFAVAYLAYSLEQEGMSRQKAVEMATQHVLHATNDPAVIKLQQYLYNNAHNNAEPHLEQTALQAIPAIAACLENPACTATALLLAKIAGNALVGAGVATKELVKHWFSYDKSDKSEGGKSDNAAEKDKIKEDIAGNSGGSTNLDPDDDDEPSVKEGKTVNQMKQEVRRDQAPRGVTRVDLGEGNEKPHVHFNNDEAALNQDGTWKHNSIKLTKEQKIWLQKNGWRLPNDQI